MNKPKTADGPWKKQEKWNEQKDNMHLQNSTLWKEMPMGTNGPWNKKHTGKGPNKMKGRGGPWGKKNMPSSSGWKRSGPSPNMWKRNKASMQNSHGLSRKRGMWNERKKTWAGNKKGSKKSDINKKSGSAMPMSSQACKNMTQGSRMRKRSWGNKKQAMSGHRTQGRNDMKSMQKGSWMKKQGEWQRTQKRDFKGNTTSETGTKKKNKQGWNQNMGEERREMATMNQWTGSRGNTWQKRKMTDEKKNQNRN